MQWLDQPVDELSKAASGARRSHAYLFSGSPGTGKRALAQWFVRRVLTGRAPPPSVDAPGFTHPDLFHVVPAPDKTGLAVNQIRALIDEFALTTHQGGVRAAILDPADTMTRSAANSLLKTLEEPAGDSLIVLIVDRLQFIPATVLSRCIHLKIRPPVNDAAIEWLEQTGGKADWRYALMLAGGGPLRALELERGGKIALASGFADDLTGLLADERDPVAVAADWSKADARFALDWLARSLVSLIRWRMSGRSEPSLQPDWSNTAARRIDLQNLFCYLERVLYYVNLPPGSYNEQLAIESLLINWRRRLVTGERDPLRLSA